MSHDATARWSDCGENEISEMPSSGGLVRGTSFEMSPVVLLAFEALVGEAAFAKRDIVEALGGLMAGVVVLFNKGRKRFSLDI